MTWIVGGAILGSSIIGAVSSGSAADTQAQAQMQSAQIQKDIYEQQKALQEPYRQAGLEGQNRLMAYLGLGDTSATGYGQWAAPSLTAQTFNQYQDPGYAFRMSEGLKALDRTAAARGGLLSGSAMKAAQQYGQGLASEEYQNAFNRYQTSRAAALSPLQQLQGIGQAAASNQAASAGQYGTGVASALTGAANAQAAGTMGTANAISSGLGSYLNYNQNQNLVNALRTSSYGNQGVYMPTTLSGQQWQTYNSGPTLLPLEG